MVQRNQRVPALLLMLRALRSSCNKNVSFFPSVNSFDYYIMVVLYHKWWELYLRNVLGDL